jgi:glioma pathogenesis-related protein 2
MGNFCSSLFEERRTQKELKREQQTERVIIGPPGETGAHVSSMNGQQVKVSPAEVEHYRNEKLSVPEKTQVQPQGGRPSQPLDIFVKSALDRHNILRRKHNVPELKLNQELCKLAQSTAEFIVKKDDYDHSAAEFNGTRLGENMAIMIGQELTAEVMTDIWYDEKNNYDFKKPQYSENTGYFTQLIWKSSQEVGFGVAKGEGDKWIGIAYYYPPGNMVNEYEKNLLPLVSTIPKTT